jgi:hypothetical protein
VLSLAGVVDYWREAVHLQEARVLDGGSTRDYGRRQQIDLHFFANALNHLLSACQRANGLGLSEAGKAVTAFTTALPQAENVRHFLEHEADYRRGDGKMHNLGTLPREVRAVRWDEHHGDEARVVITDDLTLGVREATVAAEAMAQEVIRALLAPFV